MSYTRLFSSEENLYTPGSPVVISAGALLKDSRTENVLAQLKLRNIGDKKITSVRVRLTTFDSLDRPLGEPVENQYLDLAAGRNLEFGQKVPIPLPDNTIRSFRAAVVEVGFEDKTIWNGDGETVWSSIPKQMDRNTALPDRETNKQFALEFGGDFMPLEYEDLWLCTCGTCNRADEAVCCQCGRAHAELQNIGMDALAARRDTRVAEEKRIAAEQAEAERLAEKNSRTIAVIVIVAIAVFIAVMLVIAKIIMEVHYNEAASLNESGKYEDAYGLYRALTGYKDVDTLLKTDDNLLAAAAAYRAEWTTVGNEVIFGANITAAGWSAIELICVIVLVVECIVLMLSIDTKDASPQYPKRRR